MELPRRSVMLGAIALSITLLAPTAMASHGNPHLIPVGRWTHFLGCEVDLDTIWFGLADAGVF